MLWLTAASRCFQIAKVAYFPTRHSFYSCVTIGRESIVHSDSAYRMLLWMVLQQRFNLQYVVTTDLVFRKIFELYWFDKLHTEMDVMWFCRRLWWCLFVGCRSGSRGDDLKSTKVTFFTMILYNSDNSIRDIRSFWRPLFCHSSIVKYTSCLLQLWTRNETWLPNITEIAPPKLTGWILPWWDL